jgi:hypothetical protein
MAVGQGRARGPRDHVAHVGGELGRALVGERIECESGAPIGARRAAQAQVDAARRQGLQHEELLGHMQGRIVRQHHPGAADADAQGDAGDGREQDLRRRAGDAGVVVVLGDPEAVVAQRVAQPRQRNGVADRLPVRPIRDGDRLVEDREAEHPVSLRCAGVGTAAMREHVPLAPGLATTGVVPGQALHYGRRIEAQPDQRQE